MDPEIEHPLNTLTEQTTEEERKKQIITQKSLRTLEGDIQEAIEKRNVSTASMVIAQQTKTEEAPVEARQPSNSGNKILIICASILLVIMGIGGAYYLYLHSSLVPSTPVVPKTTIPSIVTPDSQKTLDMTGQSKVKAIAAAANALTNTGNENGSVLQIIPVVKASTGKLTIVGANDFLTSTGIPAPDILFRSLDSNWTLGTYNDNGVAVPFIILKDNFFQNAYAGMIAWERTMPDNLSTIFGYTDKAREGGQIGTSTLSSYFTIQGSFKDGVIDNKDVRAFTQPDGSVLVLYSFVDNNTVVITTDGKALAEIINRLEKQTFIR